MTRHKRLFILCLTGITVASIVLYLSVRREPSYQGKPLAFWVVQLQMGEYGDPQARQEARIALRSMADKAVPRLIEVLKKKIPPSKKQLTAFRTSHLSAKICFARRRMTKAGPRTFWERSARRH